MDPRIYHELYRLYDKDGILLYVGISKSFLKRLSQHSDKEWYGEVVYVEKQRFSSREELEAAEKRAIQNEHPLHNIQHTAKEHGNAGKKTWYMKKIASLEEEIASLKAMMAEILKKSLQPVQQLTQAEENIYRALGADEPGIYTETSHQEMSSADILRAMWH